MTRPENEPIWLTSLQVMLLHSESIRLFGGRPGLRESNLLESAIARPRDLFSYGAEPDIFALAAEYGFGLARNHPFIDGNKRVALLAVRAFLHLNGFRFDPDQVETVTTFEQLAAGAVDQERLAGWIRPNSTRRLQ